MVAGNSVAPVIIKRKKVISGGGHHGGAWKVAYADFVTAMMAFFMLMWLLNATTEKQRKGIADYFNPTVPINRISGGGEGAFGGDSIFAENSLSRSGTGASGKNPPWMDAPVSAHSQGHKEPEKEAVLKEVNATLVGNGGESDFLENALKHVVSRVSDEGVVIEVFDLPGRALFDDANRGSDLLNMLIGRIAAVAASVDSPIAIKTHSRSEAVVRANVDLWKRTSERSLAVANELSFAGVAKGRVSRLTGLADRQLSVSDPLSVRNNRVEFVFLLDAS